MLLLDYVLSDTYVMEAWNTPGTKGDRLNYVILTRSQVRNPPWC